MSDSDRLSPEAFAALGHLLASEPFAGWSLSALRAALRAAGQPEGEADRLFPGGAAEMIAAFFAGVDHAMVTRAGDLAGLGLTARVRALIASRLAVLEPHKEAVRRALGLLALPRNAGLAARLAARTADAIWVAAGDRAADFSWYTKRAILLAIYSATLIYWLTDTTEGAEASRAFLDRRLRLVGRIGRARARFSVRLPCRGSAARAS
uniref:COQ9 family protein n=1 Tax=Acidicaldus sp. TaxID=1872105 RepID=A0A8J4M491_9PROT